MLIDFCITQLWLDSNKEEEETRPAKALVEKVLELPPGVSSPESTKWLQRQAKCIRWRD